MSFPAEGRDGEFAGGDFGKGRYFLFTGRKFPAATKEGREAYCALVRKLASEVRQAVRILPADDDPSAVDAITYAVYPKKVYLLNMDLSRPRTFLVERDGRREKTTLAPCEIRVLERRL